MDAVNEGARSIAATATGLSGLLANVETTIEERVKAVYEARILELETQNQQQHTQNQQTEARQNQQIQEMKAEVEQLKQRVEASERYADTVQLELSRVNDERERLRRWHNEGVEILEPGRNFVQNI